MAEVNAPTAIEPGDKLVWRQDLQTQMQICSETMRRWLRAGKLPKPDIDISSRRLAWKRSTLEQAGVRLP